MPTRTFVSILLSFAGLAAAAPAAAQHTANLSLGISDPRGAFDDNTDTGIGLTASYTYAVDPSRVVSIGGSGAFLNYGDTERRVGLSSTIPDIRADIETRNEIFFLQGLLQLTAPTGVVQPYVLGTGGVGIFATTTSLEDPRTGQNIISDTNQSDATLVWGGGGGLRVKVWEEDEEPTGISAFSLVGDGEGERTRAWIDVSARYLKGGDVEYLREGSLVTDEGTFDIDRRLVESEIELVQYQVGLTVTF